MLARRARPAARLLLVVALAGCVSTDVPPIGAGGQPFRPEPDERELWARAETEEATLAAKQLPYDDPLLVEYLGRIGERLLPPEVRAAGGPGYRYGVIRDPTLNAFAMPNGRVYLHTGLLARLENEAQLATILGHELTHVTGRHALRFQRDARNKEMLSTVAAVAVSIGVAAAAGSVPRNDPVGVAVLGQTATVILGLGLQLAATAAISGYGRDLEREADAEAMERLVAAGYDPRQAPRVFELLREDGGDRGAVETFFFGSHPRLSERIETTRELLRTRYAAAPTAVGTTPEFETRLRTVVRDNARLDVAAGRFTLARRQLDRALAAAPHDPLTHVAYGDLHRLHAQRARGAEREEQARLALARYEEAAALDPALPETYRQLGLLHYEQRQGARARAAFEKYLTLRPDAPDARRIRAYLVELDR